MPTTRTNEQHGHLLLQPVFLTLRTLEFDCPANRIPQINLAFHQIVPRRGIGIFEISHEDFRTGIQCIDHHLTIGRTSDLHSAILYIPWYGSYGPIALAHVLGFGQETRHLAGIQIRLPLASSLQKLFAPLIKVSMKRGDKFDSLWD